MTENKYDFIRLGTDVLRPRGLTVHVEPFDLCYAAGEGRRTDCSNRSLASDNAAIHDMFQFPPERLASIEWCPKCPDYRLNGPGYVFLRAGPSKLFAINELLLHWMEFHDYVPPLPLIEAIRRDYPHWLACDRDPRRWISYLNEEFSLRSNWSEWRPFTVNPMY